MTTDRLLELRVDRRGAGFVAWRPDLYVWREDLGELLADAGDLARGGDRTGRDQDPRRARASSASRRRASIAAR